jgi:protein phosphatase
MQLGQAIEEANARVFAASATRTAGNGRTMGTTIVALLEVGRRALVAHVGDSRAYLLRAGSLVPLTEDHTIINAYRAGVMRDVALEELDGHWHSLTRAVGTRPHVIPDLRFVLPDDGDLVLLCSDGLTFHVPDEEIARILGAHVDLDDAADALITAAKARGGFDNVSVVVGRWARAV